MIYATSFLVLVVFICDIEGASRFLGNKIKQGLQDVRHDWHQEVGLDVRKWSNEYKVVSSKWSKPLKNKGTGCGCVKYDCGCCAHLDIPKVKLNDTGCVNITYLPREYGISVTFSINNKVYINETVSARNPPPLCFAIPHVHLASLCLLFNNLSVSDHRFSGCISVEAALYHVKVEKVELGCFSIPVSKSYSHVPLLKTEGSKEAPQIDGDPFKNLKQALKAKYSHGVK